MKQHPYITRIIEHVRNKYPAEPEFTQSVEEVVESLSPLFYLEPQYEQEQILERIIVPEKIFTFRVPWRDDQGKIHTNTGYRVGFNSALGPYKGGLRFHASVNQSILKFLGFEQIFKNSLTGASIGGGKGGSDFNFRGRSPFEIERFCQSFMSSLYRHIGENTDVPAGDIGVGTREIGLLFGQFKKLTGRFEGVITGKGMEWGGSLLRPEATGYGVVYFLQEMLERYQDSIQNKRVALSGFGNVAWGVAKKIDELGGKVVTLSGPDGYVYDPDGITGEKIEYMLRMRSSLKDCVKDYAEKFKVEFFPEAKPWECQCDIAIPCACENEVDESDIKTLLSNGCMALVEAANMPLTQAAMKAVRESGICYAPGKAANAGGVACSALEMSQNSMRTQWTAEDVDLRLKTIMKSIHARCVDAAEYIDHPDDYVSGANIAGFKRVADAMIDQGTI